MTLPLPVGTLHVQVPRCGAGALIYYQGFSEPATASFPLPFLKPGMTFVGVGAHVREYALLAGASVGPAGEVHAFEPHPEMFRFLATNIQINGLRNVTPYQVAVADRDGLAPFETMPEPSLSRLEAAGTRKAHELVGKIFCPCPALSTRRAGRRRRIDLIKVDVEGAEPLVLCASRALLQMSAAEAPVLILEWSPTNWSRFGWTQSAVRPLLLSLGYVLYRYSPSSHRLFEIDVDQLIDPRLLTDGNIIGIKGERGWP